MKHLSLRITILLVIALAFPALTFPASSIQEIHTNLLRDIPNANPTTLQKMTAAERWLTKLDAIRESLKENRTDGTSDWIVLWNAMKRGESPSTLLTRDAQTLRSTIALHAADPKALSETIAPIDKLAHELRLEIEALDRIERFRRRDLRIIVKDSNGMVIPSANVAVYQVDRDFLFGSNIFGWSDDDGPLQREYRRRFADLLNFATLGFYWASYERREGETLEELRLKTARWCKENGIKTKGHPLAWNTSEPRWLPEDSSEYFQKQLKRIDRDATHFKGLIDCWDVVNEVVRFDRPSFEKKCPKMTAMWKTIGQFEFARQCFLMARSSNPDAELLINDYEYRTRERAENDESAPISKGVIYEDVIEKLLDDNGKPLYDAIGLQSHMHSGAWRTERILEIVKRFSKYNVPLHFTETTIVSGPGKWGKWLDTTPEGEMLQADEVERIYRTVYSCPEVAALTWWDFSDLRAWQGTPAGLLRKDMTPKPAYNRLLSLLKGEWWTGLEESQTNASGAVQFRASLGGHIVRVKTKDGKEIKRLVRLEWGKDAKEITIVLN